MCKNSKNLDTNNSLSELFLLSPVKNKPVEESFNSPALSSQGGLLLINEYEEHHGFIAKTACSTSILRDVQATYLSDSRWL